MSEADRDRCLTELHEHHVQITSLSLALEELAREAASCAASRQAAFITAQVMRHRISVALLQSRLAPSMRTTVSEISGT